MIYAYKLFTSKIDLAKDDFFRSSAAMTRGHEHSVVRQKATKLCRINSFSNRIVDDWNGLPAHVVSATTTNNFKRELDEHWQREMYRTPF